MLDFNVSARVVITCNKRLSPYLVEEVKDLGFVVDRIFSTGVEIMASINDCIKLNLNLRCASQVLYSLKRFPSNRPDDIYNALLFLPWEEILQPEGYITVTSTVDHFTVNNSMFTNLKVKDAIVDRMIRETGQRPDSGPEGNAAVIHLYWKEEQAEIFLDTSGETLTKHGYRKIPGKAPMVESLAAATVMATGWDKKSPFVNPMCGSSTLAIEAALLATNRRPGLLRDNYSFMHIRGYEKSVYESELDKLNTLIDETAVPLIIATDISDDAIEISKVNARIAGVESLIQFATGDFETTPIPPPPGVLYFNPEYGIRLGESSDLESTYARMGDFMKRKCQGYTGFIFTGNLDLAKKVGLKASRRIEFYTATIDCRLLRYDLYPGSKREPKTVLAGGENNPSLALG